MAPSQVEFGGLWRVKDVAPGGLAYSAGARWGTRRLGRGDPSGATSSQGRGLETFAPKEGGNEEARVC